MNGINGYSRTPQRSERKPRDPFEFLTDELKGIAEVRSHKSAPEPILAPIVRVALASWLKEMQCMEELAAVGVKPRKRCMLSGPPGTGKTTLAHHLAARLGVPLVLLGAEMIVGKYLGESTKNIAGIFNALREANTTCILFIDEIDGLGVSRDAQGSGSGSTELVNMLTVMLRKVEEYDGILIGATNRPQSIDPALWRRFDLHLLVDLPQHAQRYAIIKKYAAPYEFEDDALDYLADVTDGASPSLLEGLMVGMKRAMIINPLLGWGADTPEKVFTPILKSLEPPDGIKPPRLWANQTLVDGLKEHWPPTLAKKDEP